MHVVVCNPDCPSDSVSCVIRLSEFVLAYLPTILVTPLKEEAAFRGTKEYKDLGLLLQGLGCVSDGGYSHPVLRAPSHALMAAFATAL